MSDAAQRYRSRTLRVLNQKRDSAPNKVPIPPQLDFIHQQKTPCLTCALFFEAISAFMQFARWVGRHAPRPVNLWKKIKPATTHEKDGRAIGLDPMRQLCRNGSASISHHRLMLRAVCPSTDGSSIVRDYPVLSVSSTGPIKLLISGPHFLRIT